MPDKISVRQYSASIVELFEDLLEANGIIIPDEDRTTEDAPLFGCTYANLEDDITIILEKFAAEVRHNPGKPIDIYEY